MFVVLDSVQNSEMIRLQRILLPKISFFIRQKEQTFCQKFCQNSRISLNFTI